MLQRLTPFFLAITLATLALPRIAQASLLEWNQTEAHIELEPGQEEARAEYVVTNKSDETVRIARVKTSCGCTGSLLDKKNLAPGESTTITGTFNKGNREGLNRNKLEVFLDNQPDPVATLHMIVEIPKLVDVQPSLVYWDPTSSQTNRQVRITLDKRYVNKISDIEYDAAYVTLTEETDPDGKVDLILRVLPKSFEQKIQEPIVIKATGEDGMTAKARLLVFVQP
ncbi:MULTISPECIES: DUF1573 domain-containing protein [unclassified Lentimonas]|uniref:DUF1573 domain-containing protein n=1 Tax=unclassified Lentimonas TaxID=2630993 RepID=UPI0013270C66|nr:MULTISPECIES: DUF1573 domain-containing protein [unclassified Lentimonas]CAA6676594.1 Unannotated [Lentimonas sp. CC4]CAA6684743.1 Unannotated [Lentimonas sp. CC6]CAA7075379.1 Unannotated [Lentimonas sp. CC4]CAA7168958.1 Unannotated [Lentimonas sp. CC21]CAA7182212.1 Unannotated [Lentimonas sp. CC8]